MRLNFECWVKKKKKKSSGRVKKKNFEWKGKKKNIKR
jgi:hypothetical protein